MENGHGNNSAGPVSRALRGTSQESSKASQLGGSAPIAQQTVPFREVLPSIHFASRVGEASVVRQKARIRRPAHPGQHVSVDNDQTAAPSTPTRQPSKPPATGAPLRTNDLPTLQAQIGNRATALAVQRRPGPGEPQYTVANRPKKGADVRAALRSQLPGLLAGLTEEQLNRWQSVVDYYAISRHIDKEVRELYADFKSRYPGIEPGPQGMYSGYGPYNDAKAKIEAGRPKKPPGATS